MTRFALVLATGLGLAGAAERHYRLESTDLKHRVIWGAECEGPGGLAIAFGGQDQEADDGRPHTRIKADGQWKAIHEELRARNPLQKLRDRVWAVRNQQKALAARARHLYFEAKGDTDLSAEKAKVKQELEAVIAEIEKLGSLETYEAGQAKAALAFLRSGTQIDLEKAADALDAEPSPRALSPIVHDAKTGLFILFGGDHLDYLTNDTWVFDPAKKKWMQRHPPAAPAPRANHQLKATGDGKVTLTGGYTYSSSTDYCGGQYKDIGDGEWVYDIAANAWSGASAPGPTAQRVYRTGPYHPDFYLRDPKPDAAEVAARLKDLPANKWVPLKPPHIPRLDRCWGTAVLDPDRDLILVWSGGHSSHCGTDVLHYHLATNRWELPYPVEFPLGQTYSNTSYPAGFNFNLRPWVTGHTYQSYGVDPLSKLMLFTGHVKHYYIYDPDVADWVGRGPKPKGMTYNDCFYTLNLLPTPRGLLCWNQSGAVFRFDPAASAWTELKFSSKLPGSAVDYSTEVYDSKHDRLLFFRTGYGQKYDGQVHALDLKGLAASALSPANAAVATGFLIDRACYEPASDLVVFAALLPPDADGLQRTPAYDCAGNRWVSLKIAYDVEKRDRKAIPLTPRGPGHSCGVMYDAKRKLIWGVDTYHCQPYALRLDPKSADIAELK
ncbi:MAG TPA: kelch repeat-containing protein [Planctomycetota bacterium]|nr:kelch repeat-containing protein [Planctomycetota bacterium]